MKSLSGFALVGVALAASAASYADVALPTSGNGELVLFVRDTSTPTRVYARGLGISIDSVLTQSTAGGSFSGPVQTFGYALPAAGIGPDSNLTNFLATSSSYDWTVMAADTSSPDFAAGTLRFLTASQANFAANPATIPNGATIGGSWTGIDQFMIDLNGSLPGAVGSGGSTASNGLWGQAGTLYTNADTWFGAGTPNFNALNNAAHLYVVANASDNPDDTARVFQAVDLKLASDGTLTSVGSAPVPLPPALWLLGSAIVGLTGVARRRNAGAQAPAAVAAVPA